MQSCEISFSRIRPAVRYAGITVVKRDEPVWTRVSLDHRLFYAVDSGAVMSLGEETFEMEAGSVLLFQSGTPYRIDTRGKDVPFYGVNFDFLRDETETKPGTPLPLTSVSAFCPDQCREHITFREDFLRTPCFVPHAEPVAVYLEEMRRESIRNEQLCGEQLSALLQISLNMIFRRFRQFRSERLEHGDLLSYIENHFNEPLDNRSVGEVFHYHPNYVSQLVRARTGMPLHRYLLSLRIRRATELIQTTRLSIAEIAAEVGFRDPSYFSQYFHLATGRTPGEFRRYRQNL